MGDEGAEQCKRIEGERSGDAEPSVLTGEKQSRREPSLANIIATASVSRRGSLEAPSFVGMSSFVGHVVIEAASARRLQAAG